MSINSLGQKKNILYHFFLHTSLHKSFGASHKKYIAKIRKCVSWDVILRSIWCLGNSCKGMTKTTKKRQTQKLHFDKPFDFCILLYVLVEKKYRLMSYEVWWTFYFSPSFPLQIFFNVLCIFVSDRRKFTPFFLFS